VAEQTKIRGDADDLPWLVVGADEDVGPNRIRRASVSLMSSTRAVSALSPSVKLRPRVIAMLIVRK
jgi:hypothetical protein